MLYTKLCSTLGLYLICSMSFATINSKYEPFTIQAKFVGNKIGLTSTSEGKVFCNPKFGQSNQDVTCTLKMDGDYDVSPYIELNYGSQEIGFLDILPTPPDNHIVVHALGSGIRCNITSRPILCKILKS